MTRFMAGTRLPMGKTPTAREGCSEVSSEHAGLRCRDAVSGFGLGLF